MENKMSYEDKVQEWHRLRAEAQRHLDHMSRKQLKRFLVDRRKYGGPTEASTKDLRAQEKAFASRTLDQSETLLAEYTARRIAMKEVKLASGSESTGPQCNEVCRTQDGVKAQEHRNE